MIVVYCCLLLFGILLISSCIPGTLHPPRKKINSRTQYIYDILLNLVYRTFRISLLPLTIWHDITLQMDSCVFSALFSIASHLSSILSPPWMCQPIDRSPWFPHRRQGRVRWVPFGCHYHRWTLLFGTLRVCISPGAKSIKSDRFVGSLGCRNKGYPS